MNHPAGSLPKPRAKASGKKIINPDIKRLYSMDIKYMIQVIRSEGWAFFFICAYLFFEYVRPQSIYGWLDILPWDQVTLLGALLGLLSDKKKKVETSHPLNKLMVLYFIVVLLSSAMSKYPSVSFSHLFLFYNWFIIYFLIVNIVVTPARYFIFFLSFLIYSFKMSQHGYFSWMERGFAFASWGVTGAPGFFQNSGEVGIQMCVYVPMAMAFVLGLRRYWGRWWRLFFYAMPFTGVGTIIASSSRGAVAGLAASGLIALGKTRYFFRTIVAMAVIGFVVWQAVPTQFKDRFQTAGDDKTSLIRIERWEDGWKTMNEYPVLGVGHAAWTTYFRRHFIPTYPGTAMVHNIFVQCGTELGYAGLLVLGLLLIYSVRTNKQIRKRAKAIDEPFYYYLTFGLDLGLVGLLISACFVTVLYYPFLWIYFAMVSSMQASFNYGLRNGSFETSESEG